MANPPRILITAPPRTGKTTVVMGLIDRLRAAGFSVHGVLSPEIRDSGPSQEPRVGFRVAAIDGPCAVLAHVDLASPDRVGRYGVDLAAFERIALPALRRGMADPAGVIVIDELGRMELLSRNFVAELDRVFSASVPLVATVHVFAHAVTDELKKRTDVEVVSVTATNRDSLPEALATQIQAWNRP